MAAAPAAEQPSETEGASEFPACAEGTFSFSTDERELSGEDRAKLSTIATCLKANPNGVLRVEGRAHPVDGNVDERTESLALHRAQTIARELEQLGVPATQLRPEGKEPFCRTEDAACFSRNRSVTLVAAR